MSDIVFIRDLRIETVIGVYDWEKEIRQVLCLDLELSNDNRRAALADRIGDTVDYMSVSKRLMQFIGDNQFELIETVAERCTEIIREEFGVAWVKIRVSKPGAVPGCEAVGVIVERGVQP
ncbi:MAG: dihydroneopterin aldolase [Pseudomonadota bacterium]